MAVINYIVIGLTAAGLLLADTHTYVHAQTPASSTYITPFPKSDRYQVRVIGDWLASGLSSSLQESFRTDSTLQISPSYQSNFGLARPEQNDLGNEIERIASSNDVNIVIMMLGVNDRVSIRTSNGARFQPGSDEWKAAYGKEVERVIKKLRSANIAVYWVGLPPMGQPGMNETAVAINEAIREAAYINGVKFIDTTTPFTDQSGAYNAYGPDLTGQTKRLRDGDGIGLTPAGYRKLANYVEITIKRDISQARSQRNVPLAGDEEEQARVVPSGTEGTRPSSSPTASAPTTTPSQIKGSDQNRDLTPSQDGGLRRAGSGPLEPTRQDAAAFSSSFPQAEMILNDLGDGLTTIAVISPNNAFSIRDLQRQTPLADRLYFRVLSKGEALPPKQGRADDFTWRADANLQGQ